MTSEEQIAYDEGKRAAEEIVQAHREQSNSPHVAQMARESWVGVVIGMVAHLPKPQRSQYQQAILDSLQPYNDYVGKNYPACFQEKPDLDKVVADTEAAAVDPRVADLFCAVEAVCDQIVAFCRDSGVAKTPDEAHAFGFFERLAELREEE